jgi:hypothetical protein
MTVNTCISFNRFSLAMDFHSNPKLWFLRYQKEKIPSFDIKVKNGIAAIYRRLFLGPIILCVAIRYDSNLYT